MANEKRYVLVQVYSLEEYAMPGPTTSRGENDPRARLNIGGIREIAKADVVLAVDASGSAVVVFDSDIENEEYGAGNRAVVTTITAYPERMA